MNGLISLHRRLRNPEIDVTDGRATVGVTAISRPAFLVVSVSWSAWRRSFVNSSSGSMITGWTTPLPLPAADPPTDCDNG